MITGTRTSHAKGADEWNATLTGNYLWSNVNFGEAVTQVMTPLTWSVIQFTLEDWIFLPGYRTVGNIGGRPYLNISIFATLFKALGRSRDDLLRYMESTLYMRLPHDLDIPHIPLSPWGLFAGLFYGGRVQLKQNQGRRWSPTYLDTNLAWFNGLRERIKTQVDGAGLRALWYGQMKPQIKAGVWCVLWSANYSANYTLDLRHKLSEIVGPEDASILIGNLSDGSSYLESLGPLVGLGKLARGEITREVYLSQFGHRGPHEFELSMPRPAEDLRWVEQELENYRQVPVDVAGMVAGQSKKHEAAWNRLRSSQPELAKNLQRKLSKSSHLARQRELARSAYIRDRWAIRLFALQAGKLTGIDEDVFFLTLGEVLALLAGDAAATQAIPSRKDAYHRYKALPPYPAIILGRFDPFDWAADPNRPRDIYTAHGSPSTQSITQSVKGSPGSAGCVEGLVRVIEDPGQGHQLQQGEILVAIQTDISWTLLFPRAAAVVTDVGAPLSHAAIVARELGIPAVVGCGDATTILKTGDRVRVDGARGIVEILNR